MRKGNVFTSVCQEFCSGGEMYTSKQTDTPRQTATPRWGKIMFYTCLRFYSEGGGIPACLAGYQAHSQGELEGLRGLARSTPRGEVEGSGWGGLQAHTQGSPRPTPWGVPGPHQGGVSQHALRQTPQQMATAAGGIHSTGMHSCFFLNLRTRVLFVRQLIPLVWTRLHVSLATCYGFLRFTSRVMPADLLFSLFDPRTCT